MMNSLGLMISSNIKMKKMNNVLNIIEQNSEVFNVVLNFIPDMSSDMFKVLP